MPSRWQTVESVQQLESIGTCCYVLCDGKTTYYVGFTSNLFRRIIGHGFWLHPGGLLTPRWGKLHGFKLKARRPFKFGEERMAESRLIKRLFPLRNISGNPSYAPPADTEDQRFCVSHFAAGQ